MKGKQAREACDVTRAVSNIMLQQPMKRENIHGEKRKGIWKAKGLVVLVGHETRSIIKLHNWVMTALIASSSYCAL